MLQLKLCLEGGKWNVFLYVEAYGWAYNAGHYSSQAQQSKQADLQAYCNLGLLFNKTGENWDRAADYHVLHAVGSQSSASTHRMQTHMRVFSPVYAFEGPTRASLLVRTVSTANRTVTSFALLVCKNYYCQHCVRSTDVIVPGAGACGRGGWPCACGESPGTYGAH